MSRTSFKCRICKKEIEKMDSIIRKSASMKMMCCSLSCLKETPEYQEKRRLADEIRVRKIRETVGFKTCGLKSKLTRAKRFLDLFCIEYADMDDEQIIRTWELEFRNRADHANKIKRGRLKKYGSVEHLREADKERVIKGSCKKLGIEYNKDFSENQKKSITNEAYQNFRVKDKNAWKLKHLLRFTSIACTNSLTSDEVDRLYSEYVSKRFSRSSIESDKNGYTHSEKGWYQMTNQQGDRFFYRSSWEKKVFEALDHLVGVNLISFVFTPDRVEYEFEGVKRHYYPDAAFEKLDNKRIVLEIKPKRKVSEICNSLKILAARDRIGNGFHVLTEHEIFESDLIMLLGEM